MMSGEKAQGLALEALQFLAADQELIAHFLAQAGAGPEDIRQSAQDPGFLGFVLDFLLMDDATVVAFAEASGRKPEDVAIARAALPGGDAPSWT